MIFRLVRLGQWLAGVLPRRLRWWIGEILLQIVYWGWRKKRIATQKNMSIVLGLPRASPAVRRTARRSWRNYGRFLADFFDLPNHPPSFFIDQTTDLSEEGIQAQALIAGLRTEQRGSLICTGHYGSWDMAGIYISANAPLHVIAEEFADARLNDLIQSQRRAMNLIIIPITNALRPMLRLLRQGEIIATPIDRPLPPNEGIPVQFFGRTAYVPRGIGAILAKVGGTIVAGFAWYNGIHGYHVRAFAPVRIERSGDEDADTIRATQVMFDALEIMIRQDPTQWYMFRQFWPDEAVEAPPTPSKAFASVNAHTTRTGKGTKA